MSNLLMPQRDIGEVIMTAINEVGGSEGASLDDIKQYLTSTLKDVPDSEIIQSNLDNAVTKGLLLKLDNGKYKINSTAEQTEAVSEDANSDDKVVPKLHVGTSRKATQLQEKVTKYAKERAQEAERTFEEVAQDKNRNADSDMENVGSSVAEGERAKVHFPQDDDKNKATARRADKCCLSCCAKKDVQAVECTVDKAAQDTNTAADSGTTNVGTSVAKEEKANVPVPDDDDKKGMEKMKDLKKK